MEVVEFLSEIDVRVYLLAGLIIGVVKSVLTRAEKQELVKASATLKEIDDMTGEEFEAFVSSLLMKDGYRAVSATKYSGDYGIDVTAEKNGKKYAFQCKRYSGNVGVKAIQEAYSGAKMYHADVAAVITNSSFTPNARKMAKEIGVLLIDRNGLIKIMRNAERGGPEDGVDQL